jgi:hypothetical protein
MQGAFHGLSWSRQPDGRVHAVTVSPFAAGAAAAAWGDSDCARAALAALADASAEARLAARGGARLTLAAGALHAVLDDALESDGLCFIRRVAATTGASPPPPLPAPAAALGSFTGELPPPSALLLTHVFDIAHEEDEAEEGAPAAERLTLTTLLM